MSMSVAGDWLGRTLEVGEELANGTETGFLKYQTGDYYSRRWQMISYAPEDLEDR